MWWLLRFDWLHLSSPCPFCVSMCISACPSVWAAVCVCVCVHVHADAHALRQRRCSWDALREHGGERGDHLGSGLGKAAAGRLAPNREATERCAASLKRFMRADERAQGLCASTSGTSLSSVAASHFQQKRVMWHGKLLMLKIELYTQHSILTRAGSDSRRTAFID